MPSVLEQLVTWAEEIPDWQKLAFQKILTHEEISEARMEEIFQYFLAETKLSKKSSLPPLKIRFPKSSLLEFPASKLRLTALSKIQNINALVQNQKLTFGPTLTTIFGANGSGKSGYARLLACAAFSRGDKEVLRNVQETEVDGSQTAEIQLLDGETPRSISFTVGDDLALQSFYVFDTTSVRKQLTEQNTFSFCPANLDALTALAGVVEQVQKKLKARIEECDTEASKLFAVDPSALQAFEAIDCDLKKVKEYRSTADSDETEVASIELNIAALKSNNVATQIGLIKRNIQDLNSLVSSIRQVELQFEFLTATKINEAVEGYGSAFQTAQRASSEQFQHSAFRKIGTSFWNQFIKAAHALGKAESESRSQYPDDDDACLLCHQPLSPEAVELLERYWKYLQADVERELSEAQKELDRLKQGLLSIKVDFFQEQSAAFRILEIEERSLLESISRYVGSCEESKHRSLASIEQLKSCESMPLLDSCRVRLESLIDILSQRVADLEKSNPVSEIQHLEVRRQELLKRKKLCEHFRLYEDSSHKQEWIKKAEAVKISPRHITSEYNRLFEHLVADRYVQVFEETVTELGRPVFVKVGTKGKKGEAVKYICLKTGGKVDQVLSEGEKRAVALADFLTEVTLNENSSGIILDDPITSLDWEYKQKIAERIVLESKKRQAIVFTHDLHFVYLLKSIADKNSVTPEMHWIKRGDTDDQPGYVFLNNSPALESDYKSAQRAREYHSKASNATDPELQQSFLQAGFGALRTSYEAFILFDVFSNVVRRFEERISVERLKEVVVDPAIVNPIIEKIGLLSKYIEGHLHSDAFVAQKPTSKMLMHEIDDFEKLQASLKTKKTDRKKSSQRSDQVSESAIKNIKQA